jgi:transposase-like protein
LARRLDPDRLAQVGRELRQELAASDELAGDWVRRAARALVEQMLSAEVDEALGRGSYQRRDEGGPAGYRNGYKARSMRTAEGRVLVDVPQVRGRAEPYRSAVWQALGKRSPALEKLAVEMYARGLSTRDIEDLLKDLSDGPGGPTPPLLSKSAVSRVTEVLWEEFEAFAKRDLSGFDAVYLFCDAVYESLRQQQGRPAAGRRSWSPGPSARTGRRSSCT